MTAKWTPFTPGEGMILGFPYSMKRSTFQKACCTYLSIIQQVPPPPGFFNFFVVFTMIFADISHSRCYIKTILFDVRRFYQDEIPHRILLSLPQEPCKLLKLTIFSPVLVTSIRAFRNTGGALSYILVLQ